jgi:hypothetical protein
MSTFNRFASLVALTVSACGVDTDHKPEADLGDVSADPWDARAPGADTVEGDTVTVDVGPPDASTADTEDADADTRADLSPDTTDAGGPDAAEDTPDSTDTPDTGPVLDPYGDTDGDGLFDLDEVADGTDPFDPRSARAWHPEITGHPRLFSTPTDRDRVIARATSPGAAAALWTQVLAQAGRTPPTHGATYDTSVPPAQALIAEAAALVGYATAAPAMTAKALDILAAPFPDPTPLNTQSFFNAGDHYDLLEAEALANMCSAYDLAAGTPDADPTQLAAARDRLISRIDLFRTLCFETGGCFRLLINEPNNHAIKALAALGLCAMALPDRPEAAADFNEAVVSVHYLAHDRQGEVEGGWAENWNYLNYSGETHLGFLLALDHAATLTPTSRPAMTWRVRGVGWVTGSDPAIGLTRDLPTASNDPLWRGVYEGALFATMPNGQTPPVDDGNPSPLHGGLLAALFDDTRFLSNWAAVNRAVGRQLVSTFLTLRGDVDSVHTIPPPYDGFFAAAGFSVMRASPTLESTWLHVQHEPERMRVGGGAHEHADPLSFVLWALGEPLAIDPGYIDYANHKLVRYGKDHNIVLVDGEGPEFFLDGLITAPPNSDGFLHDHSVGPVFSTLAASTKYAEAELRRRFVRVARAGLPEVFVIADRLVSSRARTYTFQLNTLASEAIGGTAFSLVPTDTGALVLAQRPRAMLSAMIAAAAGSSSATSRLEENALAPGRHRCATVEAAMGDDAGFLTVLAPTPPAGASELQSTRLAEGLVRVTLIDDAGSLRAYLNTTTVVLPVSDGFLDAASPGLTLVRLDGPADARATFTLDLPPIPDPTPFIPE